MKNKRALEEIDSAAEESVHKAHLLDFKQKEEFNNKCFLNKITSNLSRKHLSNTLHLIVLYIQSSPLYLKYYVRLSDITTWKIIVVLTQVTGEREREAKER